MRRVLFLLALVGSVHAPLGAQAVPRFSVEFSAGKGAHRAAASDGERFLDPSAFLRFGAAVRLGTRGAFRPVVVLEASPSFGATLRPAFASACIPTAPCGNRRLLDAPNGWAAGLEMRASPVPLLLFGLGGGFANYQRGGEFVDANVSFMQMPHLALLLDIRQIYTRTRDGDPVWFRPVSLGLRIY